MRSLLFALCAALALATSARADAIGDARTAWLAEQYRQAAQMVAVMPREARRTQEALYIQGTSACRVPEWRDNGRTLLITLSQYKALAPAWRGATERELSRCGQVAKPYPLDPAAVVPASMWVNGKVFMWLDQKAAPSASPVTVKPFKDAELAARRLPPGDPRAAEVARGALPGCQVLQTGILTLCTTSRQTPGELQLIARAIDRHVAWLKAAYGFDPPASGVYVYLMPTVGDMRQFGARVHGLDLAYGTIGYAMDKDQSVAAVASGLNVGTVMHEITHLVMGQNYPDAPEWLEEGLASLYETSLSCGGVTLGAPNWRGQVLQQPWAVEVTLDDAVRAPWFKYRSDEPFDPATRRAAAFYSLSRYLMLHLQGSGQLAQVVREMSASANSELDAAQNLDAAATLPDAAEPRGVRLLTKVTGEPLAATEAKLRREASIQNLTVLPAWANDAATASGLATCPRLAAAMPIRKSVEVDH